MAAHEEKNASPPMRGAHPHGLCREAGSGRERRRPWSARSGLPILLPRGEVLRPCSECGTRNGGSSSPEVVLQAFLGTQSPSNSRRERNDVAGAPAINVTLTPGQPSYFSRQY